MTLKLSCQENLGVGETFEERCKMLAGLGFEAVEIWGRDLLGKPENAEKFSKVLEDNNLRLSVVLVGYRGSLLDADPSQRQAAHEDIIELLGITGKMKGIGLIVVPVFGKAQITDLSPFATAKELEDKLLVEHLKTLGPKAQAAGTNIILEPLNRGETHYLNTLDHASSLIAQAGVEGLATMGDLFHMNIEETNSCDALKRNAKNLVHVHLADNTRLEPGTGMTDFKSAFDTLKEIGYANYVSLECGFSIPDRKKALAKTVEFLKSQM